MAIAVGLCGLALTRPAGHPGGAARRRLGPQRAIARAFSAQRSHRGQTIVSVRASSVSPSWAVVRSVTPEKTGAGTSPGTPPVLRSTYYHLVGGRARPAPPPPAVTTDLARDFRVQVVYTGSGRESIGYTQGYRSACAGQGGFTDIEHDTVSPLSWTVRYVVDLDHLLSAVRSSAGTTLVPAVTFEAAGSHVTATEAVSRTIQDLGCNGNPTTFTCTTTFVAGGPDPGGRLSFPAGSGLEVGVPTATRQTGACNPDDFTLGPSLWDSGGATALAGQLALLGGSLPTHPYAPIRVRWPVGSAQAAQGFVTSPCQGDAAVCSDAFQWQGTVALQAVRG